ncbi:MAG: hypothetical protein C4346_06570 [Chloroflexota bacterium]
MGASWFQEAIMHGRRERKAGKERQHDLPLSREQRRHTHQNAPRIVTVGDLVADLVLPIAQLPIQPGAFIEARELRIEPGGIGNVLITGARLGMEMLALGVLGADPFGDAVMETLAREGVNVTLVERAGTTTVAVVLTDDQAHHAFIGAYGHGPAVSLTEPWLMAITEADAVLTSGYSLREMRLQAATLDCLEAARSCNVRIFVDAGPEAGQLDPHVWNRVLQVTDVLLATEEEMASLTPGEPSQVLAYGPAAVVVKQGSRGCQVWSNEDHWVVPALPVETVDTAGAGDCFAAAFMLGVCLGLGWEKAAQLANAAGAAKVQRRGTGRQMPSATEISALLAHSGSDLRLPVAANEGDR